MTTHGLSDFQPYYVLYFPHVNERKKRTNHHDLIIDVYTQSQCISIEILKKKTTVYIFFYVCELSYHVHVHSYYFIKNTRLYFITPIIIRNHE